MAVPAQAAPVAAGVPAVAAAPVQAPVVPVEPAFDPTKSDAFLPAVKARAVAASADRAPDPRDSQAFLPAIEKKPAAAQPAQFAGQPAGAPVDISAVAAAAPEAYPGNDAPKEQLAAWMAGQAEKRGLPPELPVMAALVESGMKNLNYGDADSVGFFQMRVSIWDQGPYKGYGDKPELQVKWFLDEAEKVKNARVAAGKPIDDPDHYGEWIADTERPAAQYRYRYQTKLSEAKGLLSSRAAAPQPVAAAAAVMDAGVVPAPAGGGLGGAALGVAKGELGVREVGTNAGPKVDEYLSAAGVPSGNPWCASFITWSLEKAGHKMPGGGWAAVQTWVRNAEQGKNGLQIVSAADARPGDIVAYDWGGQNDFGADGHIGFLDSTVQDGKFKALEGNNADAVSSVDRNTNSGNVVFIRVNGDAPAGAGVPVQPGAAVSRAGGRDPAGRPEAVRRRGGRHGRPAERRGARAAGQQERRARRRGQGRHQGRPDRPARDRRADQAQPGAQDHGLVHVLGPLEVHRGRLDLQPLLRPRPGHRGHRRRDRRARQPARAGDRVRGLHAGPGHPPERDRLAVRDLRPRLLHRRRAPEPPAPRLQAGDLAGLEAARGCRRGARGGPAGAVPGQFAAVAPGTPVAGRGRPRRSPRSTRASPTRSCRP